MALLVLIWRVLKQLVDLLLKLEDHLGNVHVVNGIPLDERVHHIAQHVLKPLLLNLPLVVLLQTLNLSHRVLNVLVEHAVPFLSILEQVIVSKELEVAEVFHH